VNNVSEGKWKDVVVTWYQKLSLHDQEGRGDTTSFRKYNCRPFRDSKVDLPKNNAETLPLQPTSLYSFLIYIHKHMHTHTHTHISKLVFTEQQKLSHEPGAVLRPSVEKRKKESFV